MSAIGEKVAVISLGMSCQTNKQIGANLPLLRQLTGDPTLKEISLPFDWTINPPSSAGGLLSAERQVPGESDLVQRRRPYWPEHNLYFWHHFRGEGGVQSGEEFAETAEGFARRWVRVKDLLTSEKKLFFVVSNTQIDLADHSANTGTFSHVIRASELNALSRHIGSIASDQSEILFVGHRDRFIPDEAPAHFRIALQNELAADWRGDPAAWKGSFIELFAEHIPSRPLITMMRYSVLLNRTTSWALGDKVASPEDYKAALFNDRRMSERLQCLRRIVLPSLAAQTLPMDAKLRPLVLMTSTEMPAHQMAALRNALEPYPWAHIFAIAPTDYIPGGRIVAPFLKQSGAGPGAFATIRLDDDDALARTYMERLASFAVADNVGKAITFPTGFVGMFDHADQGFRHFYKIRKPFTALGLAAISHYDGEALTPADRKTIYGYGNHTKIGQRHPFVTDDSFPAYIRSVYPTQDTGEFLRDFSEADAVSRGDVERAIGLG